MNSNPTLRTARPEDVAACASICFEAFSGINGRHGFPPDFPDVPTVRGLMDFMLAHGDLVHSVVAEADGAVVGSCFLWRTGAVVGIGPITVDPRAQARSVGRALMEAVIAEAQARGAPGVRLVQAAFNTASMSLYTKLGFDVREPLACMQFREATTMPRIEVPGCSVRAVTEADLPACADVCRRVHGHDRNIELAASVAEGTATLVERDGRTSGYAAGVGFFNHAVGLTNYDLMALLGAAERIARPGLLLPTRNGELFRWCLGARGLRLVQPMTLMSLGLYNEPKGAFLPSILF